MLAPLSNVDVNANVDQTGIFSSSVADELLEEIVLSQLSQLSQAKAIDSTASTLSLDDAAGSHDAQEIELPSSQMLLSVEDTFEKFRDGWMKAGGKCEPDLRPLLLTMITSDMRKELKNPNGLQVAPGLLKVAVYARYFELCLLRQETRIACSQRVTTVLEKKLELKAAKAAEYRLTVPDVKAGRFSDDDLARWMNAFCPLEDESRNKEVFEALLSMRDTRSRMYYFLGLHSLDNEFKLSTYCCDLIVRLARDAKEQTARKSQAENAENGAEPKGKRTKTSKRAPLPVPTQSVLEMGTDIVVRVELPGVSRGSVCVRRRTAELFIYAGPYVAVVDQEVTQGKKAFDEIVQSLPPANAGYVEDSLAGERTNRPGVCAHWAIHLPSKVYVREAPRVDVRNGIITVLVAFMPQDNENEVF
jgi:hypothetical protein